MNPNEPKYPFRAMSQELIDEYEKDRKDPHNTTTRRLTLLWMTDRINHVSNWRPGIHSPIQCYSYINDLVSKWLNEGVLEKDYIPNEYPQYFMTTDPDNIIMIIQREMKQYSEMWKAITDKEKINV